MDANYPGGNNSESLRRRHQTSTPSQQPQMGMTSYTSTGVPAYPQPNQPQHNYYHDGRMPPPTSVYPAHAGQSVGQYSVGSPVPRPNAPGPNYIASASHVVPTQHHQRHATSTTHSSSPYTSAPLQTTASSPTASSQRGARTSSPQENRIRCPQCERDFSRNHDMKRHLSTVHNTTEHFCSKCGTSYTRADSLKRHYVNGECPGS